MPVSVTMSALSNASVFNSDSVRERHQYSVEAQQNAMLYSFAPFLVRRLRVLTCAPPPPIKISGASFLDLDFVCPF